MPKIQTFSYPDPPGGHPSPETKLTGRAIFTEAYAVIPKGVMRDIVASNLPHWSGCRAFVLARPLSGFAETFAHMIVELEPGGGSDTPEPDAQGQGVLFVTTGGVALTIDGKRHTLKEGGYAYLPPGCAWKVRNSRKSTAVFHWIRKAYEPVAGIAPPAPFVTSDAAVTPVEMPDSHGRWSTTRFVDPNDMAHDMHVNIVNFEPGGRIPFEETHVMEHGLFVLEGMGVYNLNQDWVEVEAGDYLWLRAFCPQACYAAGSGRFRYLLYKDVNRHMPLRIGAR